MYNPTEAIVLGSVKFGESSRVVHCFTRAHGLQGYMVNGVNAKNGVLKPAMLLPLTQLTIIAGHRGKGTLERIKEAKSLCVYQNIPTDPVRNALALFVAEVLHRALREEGPNIEKFEFIQHMCNVLEGLEKVPGHFPSAFLTGLSRYLGFYPDQKSADSGVYFDLVEGVFLPLQPLHQHYMSVDVSAALKQVMGGNLEGYTLPKPLRRQMLSDLLIYYRIHLDGFGQLRSVEVLEELFN